MKLSDHDLLARRQFGLVRRNQTSISQSAWSRAVAAGSLIAVHPNVARLPGSTPDERHRIKAATLAVPGSVASHRSAAVLWGLVSSYDETSTAVVHVTVTRPDRTHSLSGVTTHRPRDRNDVRAVTRQTIPCTPPLRTLLDLGITDPDLVHAAVGRAIDSGLLTIDGLEVGLRRHAERGRIGVTTLRKAVDDWALDGRPADSVLEIAFAGLCARFGLPPWRFHERLEGWEADFRFDGTPVVVECDGWATHGRKRHQFERDRRKDDDLRAAGWVVARFTYRAITQRPADTARRIRRLLDAWHQHPTPSHPTAA